MQSAPAERRRWRPWQWALLALACLIVLCAIAIAILRSHLEQHVLGEIARRTGREVRVDGAFEARLLAVHPRLSAQAVTIGNPAWIPAGHMAEIKQLAIVLDWHLGTPLLQVRSLDLHGVVLHLQRDADGAANWQLHKGGGGRGPALLRHLQARDVQLDLHDARRHLDFKGTLSVGDVPGRAGPAPLRLTATGTLNGRPATILMQGEPLATARAAGPYHFTLEERTGKAHLSGDGDLATPFDLRYLRGTFNTSGPDLRDLYYLVGLRLPHTGAFRLTGVLDRQLDHFVYRDLHVTSGASDMSGTLTVDVKAGHAHTDGELTSQHLRLADIGSRAAGLEPPAGAAPALRVPDTPFPLAGLRGGDLQVRFHAQQLEAGHELLHSASASIALQRGVLSIADAQARLGDGSLTGRARLDAQQTPPRGELELRADGVQLDRLTAGGAREPPVGGALSARLQLSGHGASAHALAAAADGTLTAVIPKGVMRASLAELSSLDVTGALGVALHADAQTGIRCGVASFVVHQGVADLQTLVLDTDAALITGKGSIHLDSEAIDLTLRGRPKHPALGIRSAVAVAGTLAHPQVHLAGHQVLAQTGAALALGALLTPVAALLAFVSPGLTHDVNCAALLAQGESTANAPSRSH